MPDPRAQAAAWDADASLVRVALTLSLLVLAVLAPAAQGASSETRIIVGRDPGLTGAERADIRDDAGVELVKTLPVPNAEVVSTDTPKAALAELRKDPDVRYAQVDHVRHAFTSDPKFGFQWALVNTGNNLGDAGAFGGGGVVDADMNLPEAWLQSTGAGAPPVAVVDSGAQADHPDLIHQLSPASTSFVGSGFADGNGHGTHVAGIIAAERDNNQGIAGAAPDAKVMALKALDDSGAGYDSDVASAFSYAAVHGARIVNASLGGPDASPALAAVIASHPEVLFVFAAGNGGADDVGPGTNNDAPAPLDGDGGATYPCNISAANVICVGASTQTDEVAYFSNYGATSVDLFAPGHTIVSTVPGSTTGFMSGTSMASPYVAAEAALVLGARPDLSTSAVKAAVLGTVDAKPEFSGKSVTGGRADAQAAVASVALAHPPDSDGDGIPDPTDRVPRGADADGDGVPALDDACPAVAALTPNGCPPTSPAQGGVPYNPPAAPPGDVDGDGRPDASDLCPGEAAATTTGCPVPGLRSISVKVVRAKHRATITVRTTRAATVAFTVERRVCNSAGRKCRWRKTASRSRGTNREVATFALRKLARGRYRVAVRLSSPAGKTKLARKSFKL